MMLESGAPTNVVWSGMWMEIAVTVIPVLVGIGMLLLRSYAAKLMERINASDAEKEAVQLLLEGMASAQEEIVRDAKKKAADGKLTKEEIESAKKHAIAHALTVAKGPALDVLKTMGSARMGSIIKQLLAKLSKKKEDK
jgi:Glu-tRNA(Gln) amidotransferase subunit E-like FAD-binding protein